MESCKEVKEVVGGKKFLQLQLTGEKADAAADLVRLAHHAAAVHDGVAAVRADEGGQHPQSGGLSRPVGPQKAEDLPPVGGEAQILHRHPDLIPCPLQLLLLGGELKGLGQPLHPQNFFHILFLSVYFPYMARFSAQKAMR